MQQPALRGSDVPTVQCSPRVYRCSPRQLHVAICGIPVHAHCQLVVADGLSLTGHVSRVVPVPLLAAHVHGKLAVIRLKLRKCFHYVDRCWDRQLQGRFR